MPRRTSDPDSPTRIAVVGTVGVPASYGGFETLAQSLVEYHAKHAHPSDLTVYCASKAYRSHPTAMLNARLRYVPLSANGAQSIPYDIWSMLSALRHGTDTLLVMGVSGALALPLIRAVSRARIVTNIDGIEWKREKWRGPARLILRWSERAAVRWSHAVIADNAAIADHVRDRYGVDSHVIAYGGDHALAAEAVADPALNLPQSYALALCRIEPENNVAMILQAFAQMPERELVFVGNWDNSDFGRKLKARYRDHANIFLVDPVYDAGRLRWIRNGAHAYVHGHSAGGTNPSLVEMMHFGVPVLAHGCSFNRNSTEDRALYFQTSEELMRIVQSLKPEAASEIGASMREIARRRYTWDHVGRAYFDLIAEA